MIIWSYDWDENKQIQICVSPLPVTMETPWCSFDAVFTYNCNGASGSKIVSSHYNSENYPLSFSQTLEVKKLLMNAYILQPYFWHVNIFSFHIFQSRSRSKEGLWPEHKKHKNIPWFSAASVTGAELEKGNTDGNGDN